MERIEDFLLSQKCKLNNRYRTSIMKVNDLSFGSNLFDYLDKKFTTYSKWDSREFNSKYSNLSVNELIRLIQSDKTDGIILYYPEEWQIYWNLRTKQTFMSALSMLSGDVPQLVIIYKDSDQFASVNNQYFKLFEVINEQCEILVPKRAEISIKAI